MADFRKLAIAALMADGKVDEGEVKVLQKGLKGDDGKYDDEAIAFLVELRGLAGKKAKAAGGALADAFEKFFFKVMGDSAMKEGAIGAEGVTFLKDKMLGGGKADEGHYGFLSGLNKKAKTRHASFDEMYKDIEAKRAKAKK